MSEQTPSKQPTAPGDPASGVQAPETAGFSKQPASKGLVDAAEAWACLVRWREGVEAPLRARIAELERERDEERMRYREAAQTLIAAIGASGPENVEDTARRAVHRIAELERILHDAPTIVEVEEYAPGWLNRVHTALGKENQP